MTSEDRWLLPEGVDELLPRRAAVAEQVRRDILDLYKTWGYQLVIPPLMEFTDSLLIGLGDDIAGHDALVGTTEHRRSRGFGGRYELMD